LEVTGKFFPKKHELEAILRRCDHDADQTINYDEFCEIFTAPGFDLMTPPSA